MWFNSHKKFVALPSVFKIKKLMSRQIFNYISIICLSILLFGISSLQAQGNKVLKKQAKQFFENKDYSKALPKYQQLAGRKPEASKWQYLLAQCYFELSQYEQALKHLKAYLKDKKHDDFALLITAKTLQHTGSYTEAARFYKLYLKVQQKLEENERFAIKKELMQCIAAKQISKKQAAAVIVPLGDQINSPKDELKALHHPKSPSRLFFSSNKSGNFELYNSEMQKGNWLSPIALNQRYNSTNDEILLAFPDQGYQILYQEGLFGQNSLAKIDNYNTSNFDTIPLDVSFPLGAQKALSTGDHYFFSDSLVLFSAIMPGSVAQSDLYYIMRDSSNNWSAPKALSTQINSAFNERTPFLAKDGRTLYFSSDRPNSMGGYDVYRTVFEDSLGRWTLPENLGVPLNSSGDELYFELMEDGLKGYLSSKRSLGKGGMDIYSIYYRQYRPEQLTRSTPSSFAEVLRPNILALSEEDPNSVLKRLSDSQQDSSQSDAASVYKFSPLYYDGGSGQLLEGSEKTLGNLKLLLNRYEEIKIMLTSHTDDINPIESNLFLSVQQAESIAKELILAGIAADRIYLRGCAQQYPIAQNYNFDGSPNQTGRKLNQRIDLKIFNANHLPIKIEIKKPMVSSVMQSNAAEIYQKNLEGLSYKVQLLQTPTLFNHAIVKQIKNSHTEKRPQNPALTYTIGMTKQFQAITHILETADNMGFGEAKIAAYINGIEISPEEAQSLIGIYPDLKNYLKYIAQRTSED